MPVAQVLSGALLGFKVGTQSQVDALITAGLQGNGTAAHGTFYLAKDTHRLYIGNEDHTVSAVNEGVITVQNIANLPSVNSGNAASVAGQVYYVSTPNILCVYNGQDWVQINTNTDHDIDTMSAAAAANGTVTITVNTADSATNYDSNHTPDTSTASASFQITGANGISVSGSGSVITVTGEKYSIASSVNQAETEASITLSSDTNDSSRSSTVKIIKGASGNISLTEDTNHNIVIDSTDTINNIDSVTINNNTTGDTRTTGFDITVHEDGGSSATGHLDPSIAYGDGTTSVKFNNGTATLPVYSKAQIDTMMQGLNAMHYKGTVGTEAGDTVTIASGTFTPATFLSAVPGGSVDIGDTFKVAEAMTLSQGGSPISLSANTIIIANGTEGSDGHITSSSLTFDVIKSTENADTQYVLAAKSAAATGAGVELQTVNGTAVGALYVKAGTNLELGGTELNDESATQTVVINHSAVTVGTDQTSSETQPAAGSTSNASSETKNITYVTGVHRDAQGHVDYLTTKTTTLIDTNTSITAKAASAAIKNGNTNVTTAGDAGDSVTITDTLTAADGSANDMSQSSTMTIASDNLSFVKTSGTDGFKINLVWGSI